MSDDPERDEDQPIERLDEAPEVTPAYATPPADGDGTNTGGDD